jgi:uncharacterized protein (TIGR03435 family)
MASRPLSAKSSAITRALGNFLGQSALIAIVFGLLCAPLIRPQTPSTTSAPLPSFEVASIKPNRSGDLRSMVDFRLGRFSATGITVRLLITFAYNVRDFQILGGPGWISSDRFDIEAKEDDAQTEAVRKLPPEQARAHNQLLMQSLLADRFKLKVTHGTKELPLYALVVAKNGPKLQEGKPGDTYPNGLKGPDGRPAGRAGLMRVGPGQLTGQGIPMATLITLLSGQVGRTVVDQTGLKGKYDISLQWSPDPSQGAMFHGPPGGNPGGDAPPPPPDTSGPTIFTALQEQLGLKLEPQKGPVEIIVIDHVEQPSEN